MEKKFFIPSAKSEQQAEEVYSLIAKFIGSPIDKVNKRLYSITYYHNGLKMVAKVGEDCDSYYREADPLVIAIFEGNPYKICLADRGVKRGEPIYVGIDNVLSREFFVD